MLAEGLRVGPGSTAAGPVSAPKSVVTSMAGFGDTESVVTSMAGFGDTESVGASMAGLAGGQRPHLPGGRKVIPAAFRYPAAVSRRTPVSF